MSTVNEIVPAIVPAAGPSEENRWLLWFGGPCLVASLFVAAAIGTGQAWLYGLALTMLLGAIMSLAWLAISSDTNTN